jgi:peptidase MA superfamily protein/tetratricopeptide repeat protein
MPGGTSLAPLMIMLKVSFASARTICAALVLLAVTATTLPAQENERPAPEAWAAIERGDYAKASSIFREELDRSPRNAWLHFGAGYAAMGLGRTDAAISSLKHAIEYNPKFLQAMVLLSQAAYQSADLDLAVRSLEKAAALAPRERGIAKQLEEWRAESALHERFEQRPGVRFRVLFEGPAEKAISDRVASVLESAYWSVGRTLNTYPGEMLTVILYSNQQFQDITRAPAWAGGGYDGRIRLPVGGALRSPKSLDRVVTHELVHFVIRNAAPTGAPTWVNEGLASYLESADHTWASRVLRAASGRIPLADLANGFDRFDSDTGVVAYAESLVAGQLLCERLGPNVGTFLQMLGSGHTVEQALSTLNVPPDTFYAEWRRRIGAK